MGILQSIFEPPTSPFEPPTLLYTAVHHPLTLLLSTLHHVFLYLRGRPYTPPSSNPIRIVSISDTHSKKPWTPLPPGDLLIHAGDLTDNGNVTEIQTQIDWLASLHHTKYKPHKDCPPDHAHLPAIAFRGYQHIVVICGNHDSYFDPRSRSQHDRKSGKKLDWGPITYLEHSSASLTFNGNRTLRLYGAPQIPKCGGKEFAFQYNRGQDAWSGTVPEEVDVLVTHNPPKWHLDIAENGAMGCEHLLKEADRVKPTLHVVGHVHAGYGQENLWYDKGQRAYEAVCRQGYGRGKNGGIGVTQGYSLVEVLDFRLWLAGLRMVYEDVKGVLWTRIWGGTTQGGILINAALTYRSTGQLGNKPQVVVL